MASYIVTDRIRVNIVHSFAVPPRVKCEQYDGDYTKLIQATVYNGDVLYSIPSAVRRIVVSGLKPDNTGFSYDCTWIGNTVSFSLMRQMTVVDGKVPCNITMFDASNNQVSSAVFVLDVEKAALPSDVVVSSNDFQTFIDYVQAANLYWQYSKSYAIGNTGVREGENVDNAKYYAHLARMYKGSPLTASTISEMIDTERVYVYVGNESGYNNGHWYFYDDTAWVDGGVYNSQGQQTDTELITPDIAADAKAVGDIIGHENLETTAQTTRGAVNELLTNRPYVTPEQFGAKADGVTDDAEAIQNAINYAISHGKYVQFMGAEYKITSPLDVPSGAYLAGATNPQMYQGSYGKTTILAAFGNNNQNPIINASDNDHDDYAYTLPGNRYEEITIENLYLRGDAFCGIKAKCYNSKFNNISIDGCKVGLHLLSCYCTYFERVCVTKSEIGALCWGTNANANMRNCWFNHGLSILTDDNLSALVTQTLPNLELNKRSGIVIQNGEITILQSNVEAYYYGVFLFGSSTLKADGLNIEQIVSGGAAIADSTTSSSNRVMVDNLTLWNGTDFGGSIAKAGYRSFYSLKCSQLKPTTFADPVNSTRAIFHLEFRDGIYILPVSISNLTNPTIINNRTHFNDKGKLIIDFTLWDYDTQDTSTAPILTIGNLSAAGFVNGRADFSGTDFILNTEYRSIVRRSDYGFANLNKRSRYYAEIEYT